MAEKNAVKKPRRFLGSLKTNIIISQLPTRSISFRTQSMKQIIKVRGQTAEDHNYTRENIGH